MLLQKNGKNKVLKLLTENIFLEYTWTLFLNKFSIKNNFIVSNKKKNKNTMYTYIFYEMEMWKSIKKFSLWREKKII